MLYLLLLLLNTLAFLVFATRCNAFSLDAPKKKVIITLPQEIDGGISNTYKKQRQRRKLEGKIPVISRQIPINTDEIEDITIWELQKPSKLMEMWWSADLDPSAAAVKKDKIGDPFGVIMWPGSILASKELVKRRHDVENSTVLVLGAGTGVEAQCAALLGASKVIAVDISTLTLKLLRFGAEKAGVGDVVEAVQFDLFSGDPLPECDILVAADVLYNEELAQQIGIRVVEALSRNPDSPPCLLITDSQRFHGTDFLPGANDQLPERKQPLEWEYFELQNVQGSGVMIDGDQTYDATTRMVSTGWSYGS